MMSYNPLTAEFEAKSAHMSKAKQAAEYLEAEELWFTNFNREEETEKLVAAQTEHVERKKAHEKAVAELAYQRAKCKGIDSELNTLNPLIRFTNKHDQLKERKRQALSSLESQEINTKRCWDDSYNSQKQVKAITANIARYDRYQAALNGEEIELSLQANHAEWEFLKASVKYQAIQQSLQPKLDLIACYEWDLEVARERLAYAENLQNGLDISDAYQRKGLHGECENEFGTGNPSTVIANQRDAIEALERKLKKTQALAKRIGITKAWVIKKLLIDGNNLCYIDETFIGLKALQALINTINERYNIQIVFDYGILGLTELTVAELKQQFPDNVEVHVAARGQIADRTLISLANSDDHHFLISNDRFAEFADTPVVKGQRLIRHELLTNTILIHDLDLHATF